MAAVVVIILGFWFALFTTRDLGRTERGYTLTAFGAHVLAAFVQLGFHTAYGGDVFTYLDYGGELARFLDLDFFQFAPEIVKLILHYDARLPVEIVGVGNSTGSMSGIAAFYVYAFGPSMLPASLATGTFAWFGQLCLYHVVRTELPADRVAAYFGCQMVPSVVFWTSLFGKEAFTIGFFGILSLCTHKVFKARRPAHLAGLVISTVGIGLLKPYVLVPYVVGVAGWLYASRAFKERSLRVRPLYLVAAAVVALGGVAVMGSLFPQLEIMRLPETVARQQGIWVGLPGSDVGMGNAEARTLAEQLPFTPMALLNSLARPLLFEARNPAMLGAALETTLIVLALLMLLLRMPFRRITSEIASSPVLVFCALFVFLFGVAVGLTTSNLGALSRYRAPMMPFYATLLLVLLRRSLRARARAPEAMRLVGLNNAHRPAGQTSAAPAPRARRLR